jgi:enamine deaminase RidA (YjgF/YER057c/UK114 family)
MKITPIDSPDAFAPVARYSQAALVESATRTLYVSGQIPVEKDGSSPKDFAAQAKLVWRNLDAQLRAAGMTRDNLVKVTVFLSDRAYGAENRVHRDAYLGDHRPAMTVVILGIYDEAWLLEVEAVAAA